jgi:EAL domain-containing protein (putative c-di-GMP-specific phosphodiesterase class I)
MNPVDVPLDVRGLIARREVETHFQPITSIRRQNVLGLEALSRGKRDGSLVAPNELFDSASAQNLTSDLDSLCRNLALSSFSLVGAAQDGLMLFVNMHPITAQSGDHVEELERAVQSAGLQPNRVVIELLETAFDAPEKALQLVHQLRRAGFLIALDDIGAGHSNLDRIAHIRPDILKADRSLLDGIDSDYIKREVFKSLVVLSERIGGWIIAEGIETQAQALAVLELGGDLMQGYYFARPALLRNEKLPSLKYVNECGRAFKERTLERISTNRRRYDTRIETLTSLLDAMRHSPATEFGQLLTARSGEFPRIESACVLNSQGEQICETVLFAPAPMSERKSVIFAAPAQGSDHSFKEYFYLLNEARLNPFVTQPYVPLPSGDLCVTLTTFVRCEKGDNYVLVVHFKAEPEELGRTEPVEKVGVAEKDN